jgi:1-deoxy-D-xylulose-5-phosphate reductoisomerase
MTRGVALFGATGSIGESTLAVIRAHPDHFHLDVVSAHASIGKLVDIVDEFHPKHVVLTDPAGADQLLAQLPHHFKGSVSFGEAALAEAASGSEVDVVMAAIVGGAGLLSTYAAVQAGKVVCLANKESLVMGGDLMMQAAKASGASLIPIDSEHNAIFQCLPREYQAGDPISGLHQLILTCSGGPFRTATQAAMQAATPAEAVAHPNWSMGQKISVDSASLMNKGLELIEATHLFQVDQSKIEVVIHPESAVHSMVEYADGSMLAQLGSADMRIPIAHALGYPERLAMDVERLSLTALGRMHFEPVDHTKFPALGLARAASEAGGDRPVVLNAANEVAVEAFLHARLGFMDISPLVDQCLNQIDSQPISCLEDVLAIDTIVRQTASELIGERA